MPARVQQGVKTGAGRLARPACGRGENGVRPQCWAGLIKGGFREMRSILLLVLGVPIPIVILIALFSHA
jgi:hypothetical protein